MGKSLIKLLGFAIALVLSANGFAVGLGGINVASGLGQQLKADIELVAVSKAEKASLIARLASPEAYKDAGLEYPYGNKFKFQIESRADGEPYLKVSTEQPINDPFVIMLVELSWSSGKLLREYTFLLDPPGYVPEQPAQAAVQAVAPAIQTAPAVSAVTPAEEAAPGEPSVKVTPIAPPVQTTLTETSAASAPLPGSAPPAAQPASAAQAASQAAEELKELDEWIVVKRGDTMRELADQYRQADMNLDRVLVAFYRANAGQFGGKNMNRIKAGKILRLPHQSEVEAVSQSDALREIRAQAADWNAYRQKLASASVLRREQPQEAQQIATGRISSSVADMAPPVKESAKEVLKLSKGEAPGDKAATGAGGKIASAQDRKNAEQEEAIAKGKALKEEQARVVMLEKQIKELQRLAELKSGLPEVKSEAAALAQSTTKAASPVVAASGVKAASAEKPKLKPKMVEPEPLMNQILGEPIYLAGGALLVIVLGGLGYMLIQRKKKPLYEDIGEPSEAAGAAAVPQVAAVGRIAAPVVSSPDTGDFTRMGATQEATPHTENNIDPIGEADLFLNFGRDAQAEEILKEALQTTPNDHRIHLKLLGIYANRVDTSSFAGIAQQLKDSGDESAWQQAYAMGRKLDPSNPLYGGSGAAMESTVSATAAFDAAQLFAQEAAPAAPALDFDIDLGASSAKGAQPEEAPISFDILTAGQAPEMDFNVAAGPGGSMPDTGDLIFDVGTSFMPGPAQQPEAAKPAEPEMGGMEFTLDFPIESPTEKAAPEAPHGIGLAGISLNFDESAALSESAPGAKDEHWQEIATKLDLAKAYQEMGDASGAREILEEVVRDGDAGQREAAQALINQLG